MRVAPAADRDIDGRQPFSDVCHSKAKAKIFDERFDIGGILDAMMFFSSPFFVSIGLDLFRYLVHTVCN